MEVDGPESVTIKKGRDAGKEVGVLKLVVCDGDDEAIFCKVTAWRETADIWGGISASNVNADETIQDYVTRGDVVLLESSSNMFSFLA